MKPKYFLLAIAIFSVLSCSQDQKRENGHLVRVDFRFGSKFFSLCSKETGESFAIKGTASEYTDTFHISKSDTSKKFNLDSAKVFFEKITEIKSKPMVVHRNTDAPRVEIYYDGDKIYDASEADNSFWDIFRPIMGQIPSGFNPFLVDEKPFG